MIIHDLKPETKSDIEATIRDLLAGYSLRGIAIRPGEDWDGEDAIFIEIDYDLNDRPFESPLQSTIDAAVMKRLQTAGDFRFPYIRHLLKKGQKVLP